MVLKLNALKKNFYLSVLFLGFGLNAQTQFFSSFDGTQIAYSDEGEGNPIMLIHGFISNGTMWQKSILKQQLLESGYRVIVPDLRGNGESDRPENPEAYKNDAEVKDLKYLINHLGLNELNAVAYSRGSIVLSKLLVKENRIKKAVLGGMGIDFTNPTWDRRILFMNAFDGKTTEETQGAVDYATSIGANHKILHLLQKYQPVTSLAQLKEISATVLVIAGEQDLDNGNPSKLKNEIPNSQLEIVPGDHNGAYKTQLFSTKIIQFFD
ncbi:alpha/beta hydrolase [Flagellimonas aquimarina]|uniref:Alpha/beta hydrolase n=1 Tax=Flagellimonas aquimarina TaxID=2201895 RepID=A0A316KXM8_9FLAO|nr:alpha/beta hydrolase [Allomuricauda koreensis]PWL38584.1 alpha/beta hydrolase [Allomuricauda koreensis]